MTASKGHKSVKHQIISKDGVTMVAAVGIAVFVVIFCLFATKALFSQASFHRRVISEKEKTLTQLKEDKKAVEELRKTYTAFVGEQQNILGGSATGTGPIDGENSQLIIDALPGTYDFPALSSSIEKILKDGGYAIVGIGGSAVAADAAVAADPLATPVPGTVEMPFSFSVKSSLEGTSQLVKKLERSIRPIFVKRLELQATSEGAELSSTIDIKTFYAPEKTFQVTEKEVK